VEKKETKLTKLPFTVDTHFLAVSIKITQFYIFYLLIYQKNKWRIVVAAEMFFGCLQMNTL